MNRPNKLKSVISTLTKLASDLPYSNDEVHAKLVDIVQQSTHDSPDAIVENDALARELTDVLVDAGEYDSSDPHLDAAYDKLCRAIKLAVNSTYQRNPAIYSAIFKFRSTVRQHANARRTVEKWPR